MGKLSNRRTRAIFETDGAIRERGAVRPVVVSLHPTYCDLRLKGCRKAVSITWDGIFWAASKLAAEQAKRERAAARKARREMAV